MDGKILETMGYQASAELDADLVLYNTTIRDAEQKVYSYLGRQAQRKRSNPNLTWWWRAMPSRRAILLRRVPELDLVMGPQRTINLETLLLQVDMIRGWSPPKTTTSLKTSPRPAGTAAAAG